MDSTQQTPFQQENHFDRLPDPLLNLIFTKVIDAKSLCHCAAVSKRFAAVVPETDVVSLMLSSSSASDVAEKKSTAKTTLISSPSSFFKVLFKSLIVKPLRFLNHLIAPKTCNKPFVSPYEALKMFSEIRSLHVDLPACGGEIGSHGGSVLQWKAEFGGELESCVFVAATGLNKSKDLKTKENEKQSEYQRQERRPEEDDLLSTNGEFKLRIVWTISCLIAASSRHYLLREIIKKHEFLKNVVITDSSNQGSISMNREQIDKLRSSMAELQEREDESESTMRTRVPDLSIKLWYSPELELPESGWVMEGATVGMIRAVDSGVEMECDGELMGRVFEGEANGKALGEAVRAMVSKKRSYLMEMNSF